MTLKITGTTIFVTVALAAFGAIVIALMVTGVGAQLVSSAGRATTTSPASSSYPPYTNLPAGCVKPPGGYLVIANINGFNDSIEHGAPTTSWPVITVKQGTTVDITVCNADHQAHGFQITHYFDSNIETVDPGQVVHVKFVANSVGTFDIYCSIFCSIHIYMQNGQLQVVGA
jgi:FtsP/CotA-like multicopper oxidase with cupredoxin domain